MGQMRPRPERTLRSYPWSAFDGSALCAAIFHWHRGATRFEPARDYDGSNRFAIQVLAIEPAATRSERLTNQDHMTATSDCGTAPRISPKFSSIGFDGVLPMIDQFMMTTATTSEKPGAAPSTAANHSGTGRLPIATQSATPTAGTAASTAKNGIADNCSFASIIMAFHKFTRGASSGARAIIWGVA